MFTFPQTKKYGEFQMVFQEAKKNRGFTDHWECTLSQAFKEISQKACNDVPFTEASTCLQSGKIRIDDPNATGTKKQSDSASKGVCRSIVIDISKMLALRNRRVFIFMISRASVNVKGLRKPPLRTLGAREVLKFNKENAKTTPGN